MSEADIMFEKMGYTDRREANAVLTRFIYTNPKQNTSISFGKEYKTVLKTQGIYPKGIKMQELKAINKKCLELEWL